MGKRFVGVNKTIVCIHFDCFLYIYTFSWVIFAYFGTYQYKRFTNYSDSAIVVIKELQDGKRNDRLPAYAGTKDNPVRCPACHPVGTMASDRRDVVG